MARAKSLTEMQNEIHRAEAVNATEVETPGIMPPAGTPAKVRTQIEYQTSVDPNAERRMYGRELQDLAADEAANLLEPASDIPIDPLFIFLETWAQYANGQYNCIVYRLPDSRRLGSTYRRPYPGPAPENLGLMSFDANAANFIADLQGINGNSGGSFQVYLVDMYGRRVPEAVLYSCTISDPTGAPSQQLQVQQPQYQQPPPRREETDFEREMKAMQQELMRAALNRAINPPAPTAPNGSGLSGEQQAALFLFQQTDFLGSLFGKMKEMSAMAGPAEAVASTWKDRAIEAGLSLAQNNPQIVERLSGVAERIVTNVTNALLPTPAQPAPQPQQYLPPPPIQQQQQYQPPPPPPLAQVNTEPGDEGDNEDAEMDILDSLIVLLNSDQPIARNNPVFLELHKAYPKQFNEAVKRIAVAPVFMIVKWVESKGAIYHSMLNGPSGPFLRGRIGELQAAFKDALAQGSAQQPAPIPVITPEPATPAATGEENAN